VILAIDVGTSTVKAGLFSEAGRCAKLLSAALPSIPSDDPVAHEIAPGAWVEAVASLIAPLLAGSGAPTCAVVSGNGPTLVPADAAGRPTGAAITWMDRRATAEAAEASAALGFQIDQGFRLPRALWLKRHRPEVYERTASLFACPEYLAMVMTGEAATIVPEGYERYYGDSRGIEVLGIDPAKLPRAERPGRVIGLSCAAGEGATGLPRGVPVVVTGPDFLASIVGTATTRPGRVCDRAGTSEGINLCAERGVEEPRLLCVPHLVRPYANVSGTISTSGGAVDWFRSASGRASEGYEDFFEDICQTAPGAGRLVFLPYLSGERSPIQDPWARGVFLGLTLQHGRGEMSRAVVEATAFAMRDVIEVMEGSGAPVAELRVTGGPGKSPVWNQIKADVTGRPIALPRFGEAELLGDACIGLASLGRYAGVGEAAEALVKIGRRYEPDPATKGIYDELFGVYRSAYEALKPVFRALEGASGGRSAT
jgi:xylulokinase